MGKAPLRPGRGIGPPRLDCMRYRFAQEAFSGFSDDIVIIVASALVVSSAVARSGHHRERATLDQRARGDTPMATHVIGRFRDVPFSDGEEYRCTCHADASSTSGPEGLLLRSLKGANLHASMTEIQIPQLNLNFLTLHSGGALTASSPNRSTALAKRGRCQSRLAARVVGMLRGLDFRALTDCVAGGEHSGPAG